MTAPTPTQEPTEFVAGDSLAWDLAQSSDYPIADGWLLTYAFRGPAALDLGATEITPATSLYQVRVPGSKTGPLTPGIYVWAAFLTLGSERHQFRTGSVAIGTNLAAVSTFQSKAESELAAVEAAIAALEAKITSAAGVKSFTIGSRSVTYEDQQRLTELRKQRGYLRAQVRQERHPGVIGERIGVQFNAPTLR